MLSILVYRDLHLTPGLNLFSKGLSVQPLRKTRHAFPVYIDNLSMVSLTIDIFDRALSSNPDLRSIFLKGNLLTLERKLLKPTCFSSLHR